MVISNVTSRKHLFLICEFVCFSFFAEVAVPIGIINAMDIFAHNIYRKFEMHSSKIISTPNHKKKCINATHSHTNCSKMNCDLLLLFGTRYYVSRTHHTIFIFVSNSTSTQFHENCLQINTNKIKKITNTFVYIHCAYISTYKFVCFYSR